METSPARSHLHNLDSDHSPKVGENVTPVTFPSDYSETSNIPLLTPEQEKCLAERRQEGLQAEQDLLNSNVDTRIIRKLIQKKKDGEAAREQLITANLRLVANIAKRYDVPGMDKEDLAQEGCIGLMRAIDKFDPAKGRFSNHATWWIRAAITQLIRAQKAAMRGRALSLNSKISDGENIELIDILSDPDADTTYNVVELGTVVDDIRKTAKHVLNTREYRIFELHNVQDRTSGEIGSELNVSRKRISNLHIELRNKLLPEIEIHRDVVANKPLDLN